MESSLVIGPLIIGCLNGNNVLAIEWKAGLSARHYCCMGKLLALMMMMVIGITCSESENQHTRIPLTLTSINISNCLLFG